MISDDRLEKALTYLAETDSNAAELKTEVERAEYRIKQVKSAMFIHGEGTIDMRKAAAEVSDEVQKAISDYLDAMQLFESVNNKRKTEVLITEIWRTVSANRRKGGI